MAQFMRERVTTPPIKFRRMSSQLGVSGVQGARAALQTIAAQYGYTVDGDDVAKAQTEDDFIQLIARAIARRDA